jgi:hypothetical protein
MLLNGRGFLVSRCGRTLRLGLFIVLQVEQGRLGLLGHLTLFAAQFENIAVPRNYGAVGDDILRELIKTLAPLDIAGDAFGKVYEYFMGNFAMQEMC